MNIEEKLDSLLDTGSEIRIGAINLLKDVYGFENSALSFLFLRERQRKLRELENRFEELYDNFIGYDTQANSFISGLIKKRGHIVDRQIWDMYVSQLSSRIDTLRSLIRDVSNAINGRRGELNNSTATLIAVAALITSVVLGIASFVISIINLYAAAEPIILWLPKNQ